MRPLEVLCVLVGTFLALTLMFGSRTTSWFALIPENLATPRTDGSTALPITENTSSRLAPTKEEDLLIATLINSSAIFPPRLLPDSERDKPRSIPALVNGIFDWGGPVLPRLESGAYCTTELAEAVNSTLYNHSWNCTRDIIRQGNFSMQKDILQYLSIPFPSRRAFSLIADAERERYWRESPNPLLPQCRLCNRALVHPPIFSVRRWWRVKQWYVATVPQPLLPDHFKAVTRTSAPKKQLSPQHKKFGAKWQKAGASVLGLFEKHFEGYDTRLLNNDFVDDVPKNVTGIDLAHLHSVLFCRATGGRHENTVMFRLLPPAGGMVVHLMTFLLPNPGASCLWRSLQVLQPRVVNVSFRYDSVGCSDMNEAIFAQLPSLVTFSPSTASALPAVSNLTPQPTEGATPDDDIATTRAAPTSAVAVGVSSPRAAKDVVALELMESDKEMPYLPCHQFLLTKTMYACDRLRNYDAFRNYWPGKCQAHRLVHHACKSVNISWTEGAESSDSPPTASQSASPNPHDDDDLAASAHSEEPHSGDEVHNGNDKNSTNTTSVQHNNTKSSSRNGGGNPASGGPPIWPPLIKVPSPAGVRVAVALSGFLRSFAAAKNHINDKIVQPNSATVFAVTWNVAGRTKKSHPILRKSMLSVGTMFRVLKDMIQHMSGAIPPGEDPRRFIEVLDFSKDGRNQELIKQNGFAHPGLYYTTARSLFLVQNSGMEFDVVIRTRFDLLPTVPLVIRIAVSDSATHAPKSLPTQVGGHSDFGVSSPLVTNVTNQSAGKLGTEARRYLVDVGSSCKMQGMWWPQRSLIAPNKILKHFADTRYKLFEWQVCDWIEVGDYATMMQFGRIYEWALENNVFSAAQWVDHAFMVDQRISYQPTQLYLKIMRHKTQFFG